MALLRALLLPLQLTSAAFVAILAIVLAVVIRYDPTPILWIIPAFVMTSWIFKYAFAMLEAVADGEITAPVVSIEMLSPFEQRPAFLLVIAIGLAQLAWWDRSASAYIFVAIVLVLLPASIGLLGATRRVLLSLNPLAILQTVRGMGAWYGVILFVIAASVALTVWIAQSNVWRMVFYWQMGMSALMVFSLIGGVMFERRIELGHEPRISPERKALIDQREHHAQLKRVLDEMYHALRLGDLVRAMDLLEQWLPKIAPEYLVRDCEHIHSTVLTWDDADMLTAATRAIAAQLVRVDHTDMLSVLIATTLKAQPAFTFKSEASLLPVVHGLAALGRGDQALPLVVNFVNSFPAQISTGISALRQRLEQGTP